MMLLPLYYWIPGLFVVSVGICILCGYAWPETKTLDDLSHVFNWVAASFSVLGFTTLLTYLFMVAFHTWHVVPLIWVHNTLMVSQYISVLTLLGIFLGGRLNLYVQAVKRKSNVGEGEVIGTLFSSSRDDQIDFWNHVGDFMTGLIQTIADMKSQKTSGDDDDDGKAGVAALAKLLIIFMVILLSLTLSIFITWLLIRVVVKLRKADESALRCALSTKQVLAS
jgi:hypothetical protein